MLTWLDEWCEGMGLRRRENLASDGKQSDALCNNDGLAARDATYRAHLARESLYAEGSEVPLTIVFQSLFAPFFYPTGTRPAVRAYQVTRELVREIRNIAREAVVIYDTPTAEATSLTRALVNLTLATYIDIPSGLIELGDLSELRAIFLEPIKILDKLTDDLFSIDYDTLRYCAVVTPRGQYGWRHAIWTDDRSQFDCDQLPGLRPEEAVMPPFSEILQLARISEEHFQNIIEWLTHTVLAHAENPEMARFEFVPQLRIDSGRRTHGRGGDVAERFSMFRIKRLSPARRIEEHRAARGEIAGEDRAWRLGYRITVRTHERQQRCGPGLGETKRVTIAQYEKGPVGGLPLHRLERV